MSTLSHRQLALNALHPILATQAPLPLDFGQWPPAAKHLLLETCRHYDRCESILNFLIPKPTKDWVVWSALILGICELHILNKSEHAVIFETVQLLKKGKTKWATGLVNAVLRNSIRQKQQWQQALKDNLQFKYNHPQWWIEKCQRDWPDHWEHILHANDEHPPMTLRLHSQKTSRSDYLSHLHLNAAPTTYSNVGFRLDEAVSIDELPYFHEGWVSVQDEAAQLAAPQLQLHPKLRVLDACAAPGGKTCHILETEPLLKACVAIEFHQQRFNKLKSSLERLQVQAECILGDASKPQEWWNGELFDRILLDAPCSGSGVVRRHPDIKRRRTPDNILQNTPIQQELLEALWPLLAPQGLFLYATCSVCPEENDAQISRFIANHPDANIMPPSPLVGYATTYGQQILPGLHHMDGFYYCLIAKT
ncbi:MAG: 16S rRNA (cytosine(967)-C(5))-methyltransferase RsmB [Gammaproteobacteria bacterium]|nr:16S rRNA (cytosine(967)-C(5))-methyltransferase RsmB [Gammaproteobacteria bacterium]